ncbi:MAG: hypothetical protein PG977_000470 [Bartonella clarridgeiae]|nr:MAG: hypothetical protein PG977_000470 [Bartonella clarridgeiae]
MFILQDMLNLSEEDRIKALKFQPLLYKERKDFVNKVKDCLIPWEYQVLAL